MGNDRKNASSVAASRPEPYLPDNFGRIARLYDAGRIAAGDAAYLSGISLAEFYEKRSALRDAFLRDGEENAAAAGNKNDGPGAGRREEEQC